MARFFCIFHALSFELNFIFDRRFPLIYLIFIASSISSTTGFISVQGEMSRKCRNWPN